MSSAAPPTTFATSKGGGSSRLIVTWLTPIGPREIGLRGAFRKALVLQRENVARRSAEALRLRRGRW